MRRALVFATLLASCSSPLAAPDPAPPPKGETTLDTAKGDWTLFRGNALQTGVSAEKLPDKLAELWTFQTKDGIEGAPAVKGGVVYLASLDEHLYALDLSTGKEKWKYKGGPFKASPSVRDGRVYVG